VVVGDADALGATRARVEAASWVAGAAPQEPIRARVRVRYRHAGADAWVEPRADGAAAIHFDAPVSAVAPGQAAVFEQGDVVLGGGTLAAGA
jgi:tRNA-specific 2-thiouridylase